MPQGDAGGNFAATGGYGGNFPGAGGAAGNVGGAQPGQLGFGGMSPGGYSASVYNANLAGNPNAPGFGARRAAYQEAARQRAIAAARARGVATGGVGVRSRRRGATATATTPEEELVSTIPPALPGALPMADAPYNQYGYGQIPDYPPHSSPRYGTPPAAAQGFTNFGSHPTTNTGPLTGPGSGWSGMANDAMNELNTIGRGLGRIGGAIGGALTGGPMLGRQFGGPVDPGGQYMVGENGPETLQMNPGGGGQVTPMNPADKLGGMNPQLMQQMFQLMQNNPQVAQKIQQIRQQQMGGGFGNQMGGGGMQKPPMQAQPMPMPPKPNIGGGFQGGGFQLGDWRNRMGIAGLSRPAGQGGMGFGLSGLGQPGVMGQMRQRMGG